MHTSFPSAGKRLIMSTDKWKEHNTFLPAVLCPSRISFPEANSREGTLGSSSLNSWHFIQKDWLGEMWGRIWDLPFNLYTVYIQINLWLMLSLVQFSLLIAGLIKHSEGWNCRYHCLIFPMFKTILRNWLKWLLICFQDSYFTFTHIP